MTSRGFAIGVLAGALLGLGDVARAVEFVKPGDTGEITLNITNAADSVSAIAGAAVSVKIVPAELAAFFEVDQTNSVLGPVSIPVGGNQTFRIKYTIGQGPANVTDASFEVVVLATSTAEGVLPERGTFDADSNIQDSVVSFSVDRKPPVITSISDNAGAFYDGTSGISNRASSGQDVEISAGDDTAGPASGVSRIVIYNGAPGAADTIELARSDADYSGGHTYTKNDAGLGVLAQLPDGQIHILLDDQAGNTKVASFRVKLNQTAQLELGTGGYWVTRANGISKAQPISWAGGAQISAYDPIYGLQKIELTGGSGIVATLPPGLDLSDLRDRKEPVFISMSGVSDGAHTVKVTNARGLVSEAGWLEVPTPETHLSSVFGGYAGGGRFVGGFTVDAEDASDVLHIATDGQTVLSQNGAFAVDSFAPHSSLVVRGAAGGISTREVVVSPHVGLAIGDAGVQMKTALPGDPGYYRANLGMVVSNEDGESRLMPGAFYLHGQYTDPHLKLKIILSRS